MYCSKCGKQNSDKAKFCTNCGTEIIKKDNLVKNDKKELKGVGGWLALFLFGVFASSILTIIMAFEDFEPVNFFAIALGVYGLYVVYIMGNAKPNALLNARVFLGLNFMLSVIAIIISLNSYTSELDNLTDSYRGIIFSFIWLWYLFVSKRVKNTYPN